MSKIHIAPRREAQSFKWNELDASQKSAYKKAASLLSMYLSDIVPASEDLVQPQRRSQIIFIDGKRGTGKTTVLLTLMHSIQNELRLNDFYQDTPPDLTAILKKPEILSVRWLRILDLEMLPEPTNLLASLSVRIEEQFKHLETQPLFNQTGTNERKIWREFSDMMHDFALGWKTNLHARRSIDPDTYSSEVLRVERARLKLDDFPEVLSKLGIAYQTKMQLKYPPLFVLPVDDADLNPQRFLDLLDLTRRAKAPNLVFLVLGNYDNLAQLMEWKYAAEISEILPATDKETIAVPNRYAQEVDRYATQWAHMALQKMIPHGQQLIQLEAYSAHEAALHQSAGCEFTLQELLEQVLLPKSGGRIKDYLSPYQNLWELLTLSSKQEDANSNTQDAEFSSQLISIIAGPIRSMENFSQSLVSYLNDLPRLSSEGLLRRLLVFIQTQFENNLKAEPGLSLWTRERLRQLFVSQGMLSDPELVKNNVQILPRRLFTRHDATKDFGTHSHFILRQANGFVIKTSGAKSPFDGRDSTIEILDDWRVNWTFLYHDITLLAPGYTIERLDFSQCCHYWAASGLNILDSDVLLPWPAPNWLLFTHLEAFRLRWNSFAENLTASSDFQTLKQTNQIQMAAYFWCLSILLTIDTEDIQLPSTLEVYLESPSQAWFDIANKIRELAHELSHSLSGLRQQYIRQWHTAFVSLFAPEFGVFKRELRENNISIKTILFNIDPSEFSQLKEIRVQTISGALQYKSIQNIKDYIEGFELNKRHRFWYEILDEHTPATQMTSISNKKVLWDVCERLKQIKSDPVDRSTLEDLQKRLSQD